MADVWRSRPAVAGVLVALTLVCGCTRRGAGRELSVVWPNDVASLDPNAKFDFVTDTIAMNVFEPLVRYDRQMAFSPCLAKSWEIRDEGVLRFHLRDGVLFQDGSTLTAEDVAYSIARLGKRPDRDIFKYVSAITDVRIVDPLTVDISSNRPAGLLSVLSFVYVLPWRSVEREGEEAFFLKPSGTGPYRIASWDPRREIRLEAHEDYWAGRPALPAVAFRTVKGDDAMWTEAARLAPAIVFSPTRTTWAAHRGDGRFQLVERPGLAAHYLVLRASGGAENPLSDVRVRRALRVAVDYGRIVSSIPAEGAFPASQFVPPAIVGYNPRLTVPGFVPGEARRLLAEAGFRQRAPLRFLTVAGGGPLIDELKTAFAAAGVDVREEPVSPEEFERRSSACDAELFLSGWICSTGDAGELFEGNFLDAGPSADPCGYRLGMDATIEAIGRTLDPVIRRNLLQDAMARLVDEVPWIPLVVTYDRHALTAGVEWLTRADGQLDLRDVRLE
jgi:peptide/nickel transport system substrate-binding protein